MKKKVLIVIPSLEIGGGAERIVSILSKSLSDFFEITILTFYNCPNSYSYGGNYISLNLNSNYIKKMLIIFNLYRRLKQISPDLIISFIDHTNLLSIITKTLFSLKIPLIISVRTNLKERYKNENRIQNFLVKVFYNTKAVNKIVSISNGIKEILIKDYHIDKRKIITIYNGISRDNIKKNSAGNLQYSEIFNNHEIIKFINIGRLIELKGHEYLINAFLKVRKTLNNTKLFIIGDGPLKAELQSLINKNNLNQHVFLLGLVENPYKYLVKSDIFVFPSLFEGFGNVILEAFASDLPVISTNCDWGPREILDEGKYGILVNVADSDDLANNMIKLANDKDLINYYVKKSVERLDYFDLNKILQDWILLINTIQE